MMILLNMRIFRRVFKLGYVLWGVAVIMGAVLFIPSSLAQAGSGRWFDEVGIPESASASPFSHATSVAMGDDGTIVAVWRTDTSIEAAVRPSGTNSWRRQRIAAKSDLTVSKTTVTIDGRGNATAAWVQEGDVDHELELMAAQRPYGGEFGVPELVASRPRSASWRLVLETNSRGDGVVAWNRSFSDGVSNRHVVAVATARSGSEFGELQDLGESKGLYVAADIDESGNALVAWRASDDRTATSFAGPDGRFSAPEAISGVEALNVEVGFDRAGNAHAVWERFAGKFLIEARTRSIGGEWGPTTILADNIPSLVGLAVEANGRGHAVFTEHLDGSCCRSRLFWTTRDPQTGSWQPVHQFPLVIDTSHVHGAALASNASGALMVLWEDRTPMAAIRLPGRRWRTQVMATHPASMEDAAIDPYGNGVVTTECCEDENPFNDHLEVVGYDAVGPVLRELRVPRRGRVGSGIRFHVAPRDVWTPRPRTRWAFADGATAQGATVNHQYRRPGRYKVTVASTDTAGNISTAARVVVVKGR